MKFRAEGVTLKTGLGIGIKVFTAMHRIEWVLFLLFVISMLIQEQFYTANILFSSGLATAALCWQTTHLLPALNKRATKIINDGVPGKSIVHLLYGIAEISKVVALLVTGYFLCH